MSTLSGSLATGLARLQEFDRSEPVQAGFRRGRARSTFWFGFWLAVVLTWAKLVYWNPFYHYKHDPWIEFARDINVVSSADLVFVLCASLIFQAIFLVTWRWKRLDRGVWVTWVIFCTFSAFYGIISEPIFNEMRTPLTFSLIRVAGDMKSMSSSLASAVTPLLLVSVFGGPLLYLLLATITHRYIQPRRGPLLRSIQGLGIMLILLRGSMMWATYEWTWRWKFDRRIAENPHWVMLKSCAAELVGAPPMHLEMNVPRGYDADFAPLRMPAKDAMPASATQPAGPVHRTKNGPKNVIVMVLESTGAQHMGVYGSPFDTTPRLNREAAHSLVFDHFYAHDSLTALSVQAISLSTYPDISFWSDTERHPDIAGTSEAKVLKPYGYRSAFMTSADFTWAGQMEYLKHRGFDTITDCTDLAKANHLNQKLFSWGVEDKYLIDGMVKWIDQEPGKPFFMIGWTTQTHHPYVMPPGREEIDFFKGRPKPAHAMLNRYLNTIRCADEQLGRLFDALRERKLENDTIVIITGDHGEAFGSPHATFFHGSQVFEENNHVPCIIWSPALYPHGGHVATLGGHVDINPTVADLLGVDVPDNCWQGRSLFDSAHSPRVYFFAALNEYLMGVREGQWKLMYNASLGEDQLFNMLADPEEQHDVAAQNPERCAELRKRLGAWASYQGQHLTKLREIGKWQ